MSDQAQNFMDKSLSSKMINKKNAIFFDTKLVFCWPKVANTFVYAKMHQSMQKSLAFSHRKKCIDLSAFKQKKTKCLLTLGNIFVVVASSKNIYIYICIYVHYSGKRPDVDE